MTTEIAFVGDIHGSLIPLESVVQRFGGTRQLVFLGDYVNRGPNSREVLELLRQAKESWPSKVTLLRGNHEVALEQFLQTGDVSAFVSHGGIATLASYLGSSTSNSIFEFRSTFPDSHRQLLGAMPVFFEDAEILASHAGIDPKRPQNRSLKDLVCGSHPELFTLDLNMLIGKSLVCGHYVQASGHPFVGASFYAIDTGCGTLPDAPLSVLLWPERVTERFESQL